MKRSENDAKRYQTFEDLEVYQIAGEFRNRIYRLARSLPEDEIQKLKSEGWRVHKLINGYIRFLRSRIARDSSRVREDSFGDLNPGDSEDLFLGRFNPSSLQRINE